MTNGDKIRSMTDEELARWLCSYIIQASSCWLRCPGYSTCRPGHHGLREWLKREALKDEAETN